MKIKNTLHKVPKRERKPTRHELLEGLLGLRMAYLKLKLAKRFEKES